MWIPIRTLYLSELKVENELRNMGEETFVPMRYDAPELTPREELVNYPLVPAIHNLLFVHKEYQKIWCDDLRNKIDYPVNFIKTTTSDKDYATIKDEEMDVFMRVCNPKNFGTQYKTMDELKAKAGMMVRVKRGEFEGITGKFVRFQKRHYIAIETAGICALMTIKYSDVEVLDV